MLSWLGLRTSDSQARILGLPVDSAAVTWSAIAVTLGYYLLTMYPDLSVWDSPLIALVAIQGGLGHPPGYPLHTLLGVVVSNLPGVDPLTGVKLLSIVPGALMCLPILSLVAQMRAKDATRNTTIGQWLAGAFVVILCVQPLFWDPSTRVEVYTLAAFLATWSVARLGASLGSMGKSSQSSDILQQKGLFIVGMALGASAAVHPVVAATTATAAIAALFRITFRVPEGARGTLKIIAGGLTGLLPYLWIIFVGARTDRFVWGSPTDLNTAWHFLRAQSYASNVRLDTPTMISHLFDWIGWAASNGVLLFIAMGVIGWILLGKQCALDRYGPVALVLAVLAICMNVVWIPENPDYLGYLCGPLAICAAGGAALISHFCSHAEFRSRLAAGISLLSVLSPLFFASPAVHTRTRHHDRVARLLATGALSESPQNGILIVASDHLVWPLLYLQQIEHLRRDVVILPPGLVNSTWYWNFLSYQHPTLKPFKYNGERGKFGRIQRFLDANADRRVGFEDFVHANKVGRRIYGIGWLLLDRPVDITATSQATADIKRMAATIKMGSTHGMGTLSFMSYRRGHALWGIGQPKQAYEALIAGVPPALRPDIQIPEDHWKEVPALRMRLPSGLSKIGGLGDPRLNIELAKYLIDPKKGGEIK